MNSMASALEASLPGRADKHIMGTVSQCLSVEKEAGEISLSEEFGF
jgi:hypothetical protein